jgi:catechol 2,3-dioxygenase-like lactoylglutathione lyase family enzyme
MSGTIPKDGWANLVPELLVENLDVSLEFWRDCLGFETAYDRPEQLFAYLERSDGAQIMLCQRSGNWETADMTQPFGRGVMLQIHVKNLDSIIASISKMQWPVYSPHREVWRRTGDRESNQREIFVQDPNGYLLTLAQKIGERPIADL